MKNKINRDCSLVYRSVLSKQTYSIANVINYHPLSFLFLIIESPSTPFKFFLVYLDLKGLHI